MERQERLIAKTHKVEKLLNEFDLDKTSLVRISNIIKFVNRYELTFDVVNKVAVFFKLVESNSLDLQEVTMQIKKLNDEFWL